MSPLLVEFEFRYLTMIISSNYNGGMISAQLVIAIIIFYGNLVSGQTITSTVPIGDRVCPGQEITFMCVTRGSPTIAWGSREYIDIGSQIEFALFNHPGDNRKSPVNPDTVATFVNRSTENGVQILTSVLRIVASAQITTFSISCFHGNGTASTITLLLQIEPNMPQDITANQRMEGYMGYCTINIGWNPPTNMAQSDLSYYIIYINETQVLNDTSNISQKFNVISYPVCSCGAHQVRVSAVNSCGCEGQSTTTIVLDQDPFILSLPDCEFVSTTSSTDLNAGSTGVIVFAALLPIIIVFLIFVMTAIFMTLFYKRYFASTNRLSYNMN